MALKIITAAEPMPVENITLTIYAAPGLGKSTLSFTAEKPLMLDFDNGSYRAANRKDTVRVQAWGDIDKMGADDLAPYSTIVLDTAGRALDALALDIIAKNPKMARGSGALSLQGFGELKSRFTGWLSMLRRSGKDVVLICHMDEQKNGDDIIERIDAQGSSKNEIYKSSDAMCRIFVRPNGGRVLNFDPREGGFGKNPAQLPELAFPHPSQSPRCLAEVIDTIKSSINRLSELQKEQQEESEEWLTTISDLGGVDEFNRLLGDVKKASKSVQAAFNHAAKERGFTFDKKLGVYIEEPVHAA